LPLILTSEEKTKKRIQGVHAIDRNSFFLISWHSTNSTGISHWALIPKLYGKITTDNNDNNLLSLRLRRLKLVLVVVLLGLSDILLQKSSVLEELVKLLQRDGLQKHTSQLTPKALIRREHLHDVSVDLLTNLLLLVDLRLLLGNGLLCDGLLCDGLLRNRLLRDSLRDLGLGTTGLPGVVEVARELRLTVHLTHVVLLGLVHIGPRDVHVEHLGLTIHGSDVREHARITVLHLEHLVTLGLLLVIGNIKRLTVEELVVDLVDGLSSSLGAGKVAETKAPAVIVRGPHDLDALHFTKLLEEVAEIFISDIISKPLDVKVGLGRVLLAKVALVRDDDFTLALLHGTSNVELHDLNTVLLKVLLVLSFGKIANQGTLLPLEGLTVKSLTGLHGVIVALEVDETEATADTLVVLHDLGRSDFTKLLEHVVKVAFSEVGTNVLDVQVGVVEDRGVRTIGLGDELLDDNTLTKALELVLVVLGGIQSLLRILNLLKVHKTVAAAHTVVVGCDLAREDRTKLRENILKTHEIDSGFEALHEKVTLVAPTQSRVTTAPHDTAGLLLDALAVQGIDSLLGILMVLEVHVTIAKRVLILHITADTDGHDKTTFLECFVKVGLGDIKTEITNVEGSIGIGDEIGLLSGHFFLINELIWIYIR